MEKTRDKYPHHKKANHNGFLNNKKHPLALCGGPARTQEGGGREKRVLQFEDQRLSN